jgi:hypothetical protein
LCSGPANDGRNRTPLRGHQLRKMQQLLVFLATPFDFPDAWVQPFGPARFALLGRLAREQRGHARPLVETIFGDGGFEDLVLDVGPDTAFNDGHGGGGRCVVRWVIVLRSRSKLL